MQELTIQILGQELQLCLKVSLLLEITLFTFAFPFNLTQLFEKLQNVSEYLQIK